MQFSAESERLSFIDFSNDTLGPGDVWIFVGCARVSKPYFCSPGFRVHSYVLENSRFEVDLRSEKERAAANGEESGNYYFVLHNEDEDYRLDTVPVFRSLTNSGISIYDDTDSSKLLEFHTVVHGLFSHVYGKLLEIDWTLWTKILSQAMRLHMSVLVGKYLEKSLSRIRLNNEIPTDILYNCASVLKKTVAMQSSPLFQEARILNDPKRLPRTTNPLPQDPSPSLSSASMELASTQDSKTLKKSDDSVRSELRSIEPEGTLLSASMDLSTPLDTTILSTEWQGPQWTQSSIILQELECDEQTDTNDDYDTDLNEINRWFGLPLISNTEEGIPRA